MYSYQKLCKQLFTLCGLVDHQYSHGCMRTAFYEISCNDWIYYHKVVSIMQKIQSAFLHNICLINS